MKSLVILAIKYSIFLKGPGTCSQGGSRSSVIEVCIEVRDDDIEEDDPGDRILTGGVDGSDTKSGTGV